MMNVAITGASSGIGAALARLYAAQRARVLLIARDAARLARVAEECRALAATVETASVDVRHRAELAALLREFDARHAIDVVVANAGVTSVLEPEAAVESGEDFQRVLETNLIGAFNQDRYGNVRRPDALLLGLLSAAGAAGGVALANLLSGAALRTGFALLILLVAAQLVRNALRRPDTALD